MQILKTIREMRAASAAAREGANRANSSARPGIASTLALVPTMGALHDGHLSLIRAARAQCDVVAVSIFVNPTQFGPGEDYASYPRTFDEDCAKLIAEGVDLLFAPAPNEMYRGQETTFVEVSGISDRLDGRSRPGHFRGVATVVAKLFNIVTPDFAYFGQKDAAQVAVLRAMVRDLNFEVQLVVGPTVRDADGLALSSRNRSLDAGQRQQALALSRALSSARDLVAQGVQDSERLRLSLVNHLSGLRVDYVEIVDPATLQAVADVREGALIAVAAWIGKTRLIDNLLLPPMLKQ